MRFLTGVKALENSFLDNNKVMVIGEVYSDYIFSHEVYGEKFYIFKLKINRISENSDIINVTASERFFSDKKPEIGDLLKIEGQFRSYNNYSAEGNRLILTVFAKEVEMLNTLSEYSHTNQIFLSGYICKKPIYRTTPFKREITDILLAVNRLYNKSDYIPCIAWGRNAKYAEYFEVGTHLKIWGRIQSRDYQKRLPDNSVITKTAFEVSVSKMELGDEC